MKLLAAGVFNADGEQQDARFDTVGIKAVLKRNPALMEYEIYLTVDPSQYLFNEYEWMVQQHGTTNVGVVEWIGPQVAHLIFYNGNNEIAANDPDAYWWVGLLKKTPDSGGLDLIPVLSATYDETMQRIYADTDRPLKEYVDEKVYTQASAEGGSGMDFTSDRDFHKFGSLIFTSQHRADRPRVKPFFYQFDPRSLRILFEDDEGAAPPAGKWDLTVLKTLERIPEVGGGPPLYDTPPAPVLTPYRFLTISNTLRDYQSGPLVQKPANTSNVTFQAGHNQMQIVVEHEFEPYDTNVDDMTGIRIGNDDLNVTPKATYPAGNSDVVFPETLVDGDRAFRFTYNASYDVASGAVEGIPTTFTDTFSSGRVSTVSDLPYFTAVSVVGTEVTFSGINLNRLDMRTDSPYYIASLKYQVNGIGPVVDTPFMIGSVAPSALVLNLYAPLPDNSLVNFQATGRHDLYWTDKFVTESLEGGWNYRAVYIWDTNVTAPAAPEITEIRILNSRTNSGADMTITMTLIGSNLQYFADNPDHVQPNSMATFLSGNDTQLAFDLPLGETLTNPTQIDFLDAGFNNVLTINPVIPQWIGQPNGENSYLINQFFADNLGAITSWWVGTPTDAVTPILPGDRVSVAAPIAFVVDTTPVDFQNGPGDPQRWVEVGGTYTGGGITYVTDEIYQIEAQGI